METEALTADILKNVTAHAWVQLIILMTAEFQLDVTISPACELATYQGPGALKFPAAIIMVIISCISV